MALINLSYANRSLGRYINITYDDVLHDVVGSAVTGTPIAPDPGITSGTIFYTQFGIGEYWDVKAKNTAPYATVVRTAYVIPCDITITGIAVVPAMNGNNGSITVTATGTGTLRYILNAGVPQVSNVFLNRPPGVYTVRVIRTQDSCFDSDSAEILFIPDLVANAIGTDTTSVGADDGKVTVNILNGSGDYSVEFVTEGVTVPSDGSVPIVRVGLAPDLYDIEVTDNVSGQVLHLQVTISNPVVSTTNGSIFEVPILNSIRYVLDNVDAEQGLDNTLLCQSVFGLYDQVNYFQKYNIGDKPKTQFNSNYAIHHHELRNYYDDSLITSFPVIKVEDNLSKISTFGITLEAGDPGQTKVFFNTAEIPVPIAAGDVFNISDNVAFNGDYSVVELGFDEDDNSQFIIITKAYGAPVSNVANANFKGTVNFDVFESTVDFTGVAEGKYYLRLDASLGTPETLVGAMSEPIEIKERHENVLLVVYNNYDNAFGVTWATGYVGFVRVEGLFGHKRPTGGDRTISRDADFSITKISARKTRNLILEFFTLPPYLAEKLSVILDCDVYSINNIPCQSSEGLQIDNIDGTILVNCNINIEQLNWFDKYNSNDNLMSTVSEDGECLCDEMDMLAVSTNTAGIVLNMDSKRQRIFTAQPIIDVNRVFSLSNAGSALSFKLRFELSQDFVDNVQYLEFPNTFSIADGNWDGGTKRWTPVAPGKYVMEATFDGTNWLCIIFGSF